MPYFFEKIRWKKSFFNLEEIIFCFLLIVFLYPVWAYPYFPSQDGPAHLYNSSLIFSFNDQSYPVFAEYLYVNNNIDPTWFSHLILAGLMLLFPALIAEKIFISLYVVLLPLGARYAIHSVKPESRYLSIIFFPLVYNYTLHMGFYAFSLSLPIGLFVIGYWLKNYYDLSFKKICYLWILTILLYLNHIVSLGMVVIVIGGVLIGMIANDMYIKTRENSDFYQLFKHEFDSKIVKTIYAFFPSVIIASFFIISKDTISIPGEVFYTRIYNFIHMMPVVSFSWKELWLVSFFILFMFVISTHILFSKLEKKEFNSNDSFLIAFVICLTFYLFVPQPELVSLNGMSGGGYMDMRVSYYVYFSLFLWIATQNYSKLLKVCIQFIVIVLSIGLIACNVSAYKKVNDYIDEYLSVSNLIEPNSTLLPLDSCGGSWNLSYKNRIKPFLHVSNHIGTQRRVMVLRNYEANIGYFPFIYRSKTNPYIHIGTLECERDVPKADFIDYQERTGGQIDYVSVWLGKKVQQNNSNLLSIYQQLKEGYDLIYESQEGGVELYRRKDWEKHESFY